MLKIIKNIKLFLLILLLAPVFVFAQDADKLSLAITPPLIKINMNPGETWSSSVKFINNNTEPLTIYTQVLDFKSGEDGGLQFIREEDEKTGDKFLLSQWLELGNSMIVLPPLEGKEIPFTINIPADGEAGGHYAAILAGTKPAEGIMEGSAIKISSMLSSLVMLNVRGKTMEEGEIREFTTDKEFYKDPKVKLIFRFANTGNVHLQPRGEIKIYNFFGKEKGSIPINVGTEFGNVLPQSVRKWEFDWQGENGFLESGRYRAEIAVNYGEEAKQNASSTIYFWVVDIKTTGLIFGSVIFLIILLTLYIRYNVRKAVKDAQKIAERKSAPSPDPVINTASQINKKSQMVDLRKMYKKD